MLKAFYTSVVFILLVSIVSAQAIKWGDQHNGTYVNPILPGDFQEPDVTRVNAEYFCVSTTKESSPGILIMSSKDMVNWKIVGHALGDISQINEKYNFDKLQSAGRGISAGAIRFHDNKFTICFSDPDGGIFVVNAEKIGGLWKVPIQLLKGAGWASPCVFWDDNGQGYLSANNTTEAKVHLFKLNADGDALVAGADNVIQQAKGVENVKLYKIKNFYYQLYTEVTAEGRIPFIARSANINGPYTDQKQLLHKSENNPNQGSLVNTVKDDWYYVVSNGTSKWSGHEMNLVPVSWVNDWPAIGAPGKDGVGAMVTGGKKPANDAYAVVTQTSDDFNLNTKVLSPQWEWFGQPNGEKWSLTERPGYLRLYVNKPLEPGMVTKIPDVITQRPLRLTQSIATVKFDVAHMVDGQLAAFSLFGKTTGTIGILQSGNSRHFYFSAGGKTRQGIEIDIANVWVRAIWDANGLTKFYYSTDGINYDLFGDPYTITNFANGSGAKIGIYTVGDISDGTAFVDVDWFHYGIGN